MWYPNVTLNKWLRMYPAIKQALPLECVCGKMIINIIPYVSKDWLGVKGDCGCGLPSADVGIRRGKK